jgi:curved DNA-binding protein CbpA
VPATTFRGDPYRVLDLSRDASAHEIKRRWRELARAHHPDRAADGEEQQRLTTRMARINAAYDVLRDPVRRARYDATPAARRERAAAGHPTDEDSGPPPPPPTPPVTARFDTSALFRARNGRTLRPFVMPGGQAPADWRLHGRRRDLRASAPTGPAARSRHATHIRLPSLEEARGTILGFGRFHGLTLGEVAEREPTYIDWIASTITRDRDLVMRARVIASDLDERGVERRPRVAGHSL